MRKWKWLIAVGVVIVVGVLAMAVVGVVAFSRFVREMAEGGSYHDRHSPGLASIHWMKSGRVALFETLPEDMMRFIAVSRTGAVTQVAKCDIHDFDGATEGPAKDDLTCIYSPDGEVKLLVIIGPDGKTRASKEIDSYQHIGSADWSGNVLTVVQDDIIRFYTRSLEETGRVELADFSCYFGRLSPYKKGHAILVGRLNGDTSFVDAELSTGKTTLLLSDVQNSYRWMCYKSGRLYYQTSMDLCVLDCKARNSQVWMPGYGTSKLSQLSWNEEHELAVGVLSKNGAVVRIDALTKEVKQLVPGPGNSYPDLSVNGRDVAFIKWGTKAIIQTADGKQSTVYKMAKGE